MEKSSYDLAKICILIAIQISFDPNLYINWGYINDLFKKVLAMYPILKFGIGGIPGAFVGCVIIYAFPKDVNNSSLLIFISIVAFFVKESINFSVHRLWTFKGEERRRKNQLLMYFYMTGVILTINTALFYVLTERYKVDEVWSQIMINLFLARINNDETKDILTKKTQSS